MIGKFFSGVGRTLLGVSTLAVLMSIWLPTTIAAQADPGLKPAQTACDSHFLTIPAWYNGIATGSSDGCVIASPTDVGGISTFIWKIGLNIVEIILNLVGYTSVGFLIYGGYKYMISAGSPDGMVSARKTITNAVIGLIISIASIAIVQTISASMGGLA